MILKYWKGWPIFIKYRRGMNMFTKGRLIYGITLNINILTKNYVWKPYYEIVSISLMGMYPWTCSLISKYLFRILFRQLMRNSISQVGPYAAAVSTELRRFEKFSRDENHTTRSVCGQGYPRYTILHERLRFPGYGSIYGVLLLNKSEPSSPPAGKFRVVESWYNGLVPSASGFWEEIESPGSFGVTFHTGTGAF